MIHQTKINIHTHGLAESFDHLDLQIVLPLSQETAGPILKTIVDRIKDGEHFSDGDILESVIANGYCVKMVNAEENDRPVLRIIFPDAKGNFDLELITGNYVLQYKGLT